MLTVVNTGIPGLLSPYLRRDYFLLAVAVFLLYFLSGKLGHYIFFELNTAPAIVWPPVGIALMAMYLWGYRMWLPIAVGQFFISFTSPAGLVPLHIATATVAYTLQPFLGTYLLRRFGFIGSFSNSRDTLVFLGVALMVPVVAPALTTLIQLFLGTLTVTPWANLSRAWAGGVMSALVLVPLVTPWAIPLSSKIRRPELVETALALGSVVVMTYVVFWTALPRLNVFMVLFFLFVTLFWVGLRVRPRFLTLSLFLVASLGILGSIIAAPTATPLNQQLFADELFMILIAPIFLIMSGLVTERSRAITEFAQRTRELEDALARLSAEDKAKTEFIATLAHELRNPLSPVMSTLELIKLSNVPQDLRALVEGAQLQTHNMKRLLDDLLDAARLTQRSFVLRKESVELSALIRHSVASTQGYLGSKQHLLQVFMPQAPLWLEADPMRLEQVLVNLLNNAGKYTNPGGTIKLECRREDNTLIIEVSDTGIGIEQKNLPYVFEPFGGAEGSGRRPGGLRLGLSLAKRMAELHGGTLCVKSAGAGQGSTFTLTLPLTALAKPVVPTPSRLSSRPSRPKAVAARYKILVVDDNEAAAQGIGKLLEREGHKVALAYSGKEALQEISRFNPELMLLDIELPDLDGYEVARQARAITDCAMVALTGYGQESDRERTRQMGFSHHITKPIGIAELQNLIGGLRSR